MSIFSGYHDGSDDTQSDGTDLVVYGQHGERILIGKVKIGPDGKISGEITDDKYANLIRVWRPGDFSIVPEPARSAEPESFLHNVFDQ